MAGLGDFAFSTQLRDVIAQMVRNEIDAQRPPYRYGIVQSINYTTNKATVILNGDTGAVTVNFGFIQPTSVGQTVRVDGQGVDRYIADVVGQPRRLTIDRLPTASNAYESTGVDFNTLTTPGIWSFNSTGAGLSSNSPSTIGGMLEVITDPPSGLILQRYTMYSTGTSYPVYERFYYSGSWRQWRGGPNWQTADIQQMIYSGSTVTVTTTEATVGTAITFNAQVGDKFHVETVWDVTVGAPIFLGKILINGTTYPVGEAHLSGGTATVRGTVMQNYVVDVTTAGSYSIVMRVLTTTGTATLNASHTKMIATLLRQQ